VKPKVAPSARVIRQHQASVVVPSSRWACSAGERDFIGRFPSCGRRAEPASSSRKELPDRSAARASTCTLAVVVASDCASLACASMVCSPERISTAPAAAAAAPTTRAIRVACRAKRASRRLAASISRERRRKPC
jgi:hypothetical protein